MPDRRIVSVGIWGDAGGVCDAARRTQDRDCIVGRAVRHNSHSDEHDQEVYVDGQVCEPAILLQSTHLPDEESANGPDQTTDGITKVKFRNLRDSLSVADDNESDLTEQLDTLEDVDSVARDGAIDPEGHVSVILH